ncbi:HD-GYP domain-containing protein [Thiovulum sp. ES]|nr:HD-GYP domain-containing protein [Thiovulum sp. ES]
MIKRYESYLRKLFNISIQLSTERDIFTLLEKILKLSREFANADAGSLCLKEGNELVFKVIQNDTLNISVGGEYAKYWSPVVLKDDLGKLNYSNVSSCSAITKNIIMIDNCYDSTKYNFSGMKKFDKINGYKTTSMLVIPLLDFDRDVIGVLQLINKLDENGNVVSFSNFDRESSVALSSQATIALLNANMYDEMETFLESFISSIGEAVDAKSPYTGNHVKKVSRFVKIVANAVDKDRTVFRNENFNKERLKLMEISAWLHDVGKITVPDHVMDKATKLETLIDKIDLIKERIEILKRDCKIEFLEKKISEEEYKREIEKLDNDFSFLEIINFGTEFMHEKHKERVLEIAKRKYFFNGVEVSLLRDEEVENLIIKRGTLTASERDRIMSHAEMTSKILEKIPFPKQFRDAKHIASNHHEKLNGKGYPRGLSADELSFDDRLLAIGDVFEALTSSDRPYKKPKKLSEVFKILSFMVKDGEIDGDIVRFIFDKKIYLEYATEELLAEQLDEPDILF